MALAADYAGLRERLDDRNDMGSTQRLLPWARYVFVGGSGLVAMHGSAEFALGCLAACIGKGDAAVRHLGAAVDANHNAGPPPFEAESRYEPAKVLAHRVRPGDRSEALLLATNASR